MNNKLLIWIFVFVLLAGSVLSLPSTTEVIVYLSGDTEDTVGTTAVDLAGNYNGTERNTPTHVPGILAEAFYFDKIAEEDVTFVPPFPTSDMALNVWLYYNTTNANIRFIIGPDPSHYDTDNFQIHLFVTPGTWGCGGDANTLDTVWSTGEDGKWFMATFVLNATHHSFWYNGVLNNSVADNSGCWNNDGTNALAIGSGFNDNWANVIVDELSLWDTALSPADIQELYNGGDGFNPFTHPTPVLTSLYPTEGLAYNDYNGWINITSDINVSTCWSNNTDWVLQSVIGNNCTFFNSGYGALAGGTHSLNITANSTESGLNGSIILTFTIDTTSPLAATNFTNGTYTNGDMPLYITYTDNIQVYKYNISLNGNRLLNKSSLSGTTVLFNTTITTTNLSALGINLPGRINISTTVCDGHTATDIKDFSVIKDGDKLSFDNTWIESSSKVDSIKTQKTGDRYSFTFEYTTPSTKRTFYVPQSCDYIENSIYKGHFVCPSENKWIDFEGKYDIVVKGHEVTATSWNPTKVWTFNSIGELNCNSYDLGYYYFYNTSTTSTANVIEQTTQTFKLRIDYPSGADNMTAALLYNGTSYAGTMTNGTGYSNFTATVTIPIVQSINYTHSFYWNYTIGDSSTYLQTSSENQTAYEIIVNNCSTTTNVYALNITFLNASDDTWTNINFEGTFDFWFNSYSYLSNYSYQINSINTTNLCIYPNWATYQTNAQIVYSGFNYNLWNYTLSNVTRSLNLYTTEGTTTVVFTVLDQDDRELENVIIKVLLYDVGTGTFNTVEILQTDYLGQAIGNIILNTERYKFILELNGEIILETSETIITSSTRTFRVTIGSDYFENYDVTRGISHSLTFTNATKTFSFTYSDPTGGIGAGCLKVERNTINGITVLDDTCLEGSAAGTITYVISEDTGVNTYTGIGYVHFDEMFTLDLLSVSFNDLYQVWGKTGGGLFFSFLLILAISLVSIWSPAVAIIGAIIGMAATLILGLSFISKSVFIVVFIFGIIISIFISRVKG